MRRSRVGLCGLECGMGTRSLRISAATLPPLPKMPPPSSAAYYSTGFNRRKREESQKRQEEERRRKQQQDGRGGTQGNQDEWLRSDERTESLRASERQVLRLGVPFAIAILVIAQGSTLLFGNPPTTPTTTTSSTINDTDEQLLLDDKAAAGDDDERLGDELLLDGEKE